MAERFLLPVLEDNFVQLRIEAKQPGNGRDALDAEARLLGNLVVLIAAGDVENPAAYCAEMLGRLDEIRLHSPDSASLELLDPAVVREDMGSDRFTYLHLHHGEIFAAQAITRKAAAEPARAPKTQPTPPRCPDCGNVPGERGHAGLLKVVETNDTDWPLKEVPSSVSL